MLMKLASERMLKMRFCQLTLQAGFEVEVESNIATANYPL